MSESIQPTPFRKLNYTPFCDLIRGRVTGRLDVKLAIETADLPESGKAQVRRIVRQTRLWRTEKYEVATELVAHFRDGLDQGATIEELLNRFGDERSAAKLIRRAKTRNRPIIWHLFRAIWMATISCILLIAVFYASASFYFFTGQPSPNVDYIAIINRKAEQVPLDQRAWSIYRDLHLTFYDHNSDKAAEQFGGMIFTHSRDARWPEFAAWLGQHQNDLERIRSASEKPALGMIFASDGISGDPRLAPNSFAEIPFNTPMIGAAVAPYQYVVEHSAAILGGDAMLAAQQRNSSRVMEDVQAMLRVARQLHENGNGIALYTVIEIRELVVSRINDILVENPDSLRDADLQQLAHLLAKPDTSADLMANDLGNFIVSDVVQRIFTDSGNGNGRLTPAGLQGLLARQGTMPPDVVKRKELLPLFMIAGPSRAQVMREANRLHEMAEANLRLNPWEIPHAPMDRKPLLYSEPLAWFGRLTFSRMFPSGTTNVPIRSEHYLGHRDGVLIGIALESYQRAHNGKYPEMLDQLRPVLLPSLPLDRITGGPLHYRLIDGKPLVYSVGDDRDDDGGKLPAAQDDDPLPPWNIDLAARWVKQEYARDGDWILYPQPRSPVRPQ